MKLRKSEIFFIFIGILILVIAILILVFYFNSQKDECIRNPFAYGSESIEKLYEGEGFGTFYLKKGENIYSYRFNNSGLYRL